MRVDLRGKPTSELRSGELAGLLPRAELDVEAALAAVRPVCEDVRRRGGPAVREHTARFDGVDLASTRVPQQALDDALAALTPELRAALEEAARRARLVHLDQVPDERVTTVAPGSTVSVPLYIANQASNTAGVQWTLSYSPSDFTSVSFSTGAAADSAGKNRHPTVSWHS